MAEAEAVPEHVNLVVLGHFKSGKSTLLGRWMAEVGALEAGEMECLEKEGHGSLKYAYVWDKLQAERQQGRTIDMHVRACKTRKLRWSVVDVPGHRRHLKNALTGLSSADCVLFVLDASPGVFESHIEDSSIEEGVNSQIKEHLLLLYALGIKQIVVAVNKMDSCGYDKERFDSIVLATTNQMRKLNLAADQARFIPVSGLQGDNLMAPSKSMAWHTGSTLLEALEAVEPSSRPLGRPFRMPVQDVYRIGGIGTVVCGKIESGELQEGSTVLLAPSGITAQVKSIEMHQRTLMKAGAGDTVGISLRGVSTEDVRRGMVAMPQDTSSSTSAACIQVTSFQATVSVRRAAGIGCGYCATLDVHTAHVPCRFARIISKLDRKTGKVLEHSPSKLADRDIGSVELVPLRPLFLEEQKEFGALGRFVMQDMHQIVAFGAVKSVERSAVQGGCKPGSLARARAAESSAAAVQAR